MIVSCLFWQMIPEKGFFRGIVAIILASPKLFLAPTPSHLLSLLFVFLTASTLVSFDGFFVVVACLYLFVVFSVMIFHPSAHCFSEPSQKNCSSLHLHSHRDSNLQASDCNLSASSHLFFPLYEQPVSFQIPILGCFSLPLSQFNS